MGGRKYMRMKRCLGVWVWEGVGDYGKHLSFIFQEVHVASQHPRKLLWRWSDFFIPITNLKRVHCNSSFNSSGDRINKEKKCSKEFKSCLHWSICDSKVLLSASLIFLRIWKLTSVKDPLNPWNEQAVHRPKWSGYLMYMYTCTGIWTIGKVWSPLNCFVITH